MYLNFGAEIFWGPKVQPFWLWAIPALGVDVSSLDNLYSVNIWKEHKNYCGGKVSCQESPNEISNCCSYEVWNYATVTDAHINWCQAQI